MKWLITGGAGFIGCHAAERFHQAGDEVVILDNLSRSGADRNLTWLKERGLKNHLLVNIADGDAVLRAFQSHSDVDAILHLAGQVAVTSSIIDPLHDFNANAFGTFHVLEATRAISKNRADGGPALIYSSTNKVYGGLEKRQVVERDGRYAFSDHPFGISEEEPLDFHSPYGCSKGTGDQYVRDYARIYGLKTVVLRQSCIYGTRQFGVEDQGWIAWFCIAVVTGKPISIYGDGKQVRDALWVEDLIDLYQAAVNKIDLVKGDVFNAGGGPDNSVSLLQTLGELEKLSGRPLSVKHGPARPGDQKVFIADIRKASQTLGWRPTVRPADGIARLYAWINDHHHYFKPE